MHHARRLAFGIVFLAYATSASAQDDQTTTALGLFEEGQRLAQAGKWSQACPKFLESYKLVEKLGTLLNLADCYESNGQTASAWGRFREAIVVAQRGNQPDRVQFAKEHAEALAPKLATLTISVAHTVVGMEIKRDDSSLGVETVGVAVPIDPGEHAIEVSAPDKIPWRTTIIVPATSAQTLHVPELEDVPHPVAHKPCEFGDATCGRPFPKRSSFLQFRLSFGFHIGGFFNGGLSSGGLEGAHTRLFGGIEIGATYLRGLNGSVPVDENRPWHAFVLEPIAGIHAGSLLGVSPYTNNPKASGELLLRMGVNIGYQFLKMAKYDPLSGHRVGLGFMLGYRPEIEYAYTDGFFTGSGVDFAHGPVAALVIGDYRARTTGLLRSFIEIHAYNVPAKSGLFIGLMGGVSLP